MLPVTETTPLDHSETEKAQKASLEGRTVVKLPTNKDEWKPVHYPGYLVEMYCTYEQIIDAISSWGKVEAILMNHKGLSHRFFVKFNKPIKFSGFDEGLLFSTNGGEGIHFTPFELLRGRHSVILSKNRMAFNIRYLKVGSLGADDLLRSLRILPDDRLEKINKENKFWEQKQAKVEAIFSESDKSKKLLEWIRRSGEVISEKGLYKCGRGPCLDYSVDRFISEYTDRSTTVIMKASRNGNAFTNLEIVS